MAPGDFEGIEEGKGSLSSVFGRLLPFLKLEIGRDHVAVNFDIRFDGSRLNDAENLVRFLPRGRSAKREECIL